MAYNLTGFADEIDRCFDVQLDTLRSLGLRFLELRSADGVNVADFTEEKREEVRDKLSACGIAVSAIGSPIGKIGIQEDFEPHFASFERIVALAKFLGTRFIRVFSFYIPKGEDPEGYREAVFARMERMVAYAKAQDVVLLHENEKGIYGDMANRCEALMKRFYGPHCQAVFDFANFVECGQETSPAYEALKPYIGYVHIKDARSADKRIVPAGEGDGAVQAILADLFAARYDGFLSLEPHLTDFSGFKALEMEGHTLRAGDGKAAFALALRSLQDILARIGA